MQMYFPSYPGPGYNELCRADFQLPLPSTYYPKVVRLDNSSGINRFEKNKKHAGHRHWHLRIPVAVIGVRVLHAVQRVWICIGQLMVFAFKVGRNSKGACLHPKVVLIIVCPHFQRRFAAADIDTHVEAH